MHIIMPLPTIGEPAPDFKTKAVLNNKVFDISLGDYDKQYVVLLFFPTNLLNMPHKEDGIRGLRIPLIADKSMAITSKYGVLDEERGIAYRGLFIIDNKGILRQITVNDYPVGRSVPETFRLIKAFQDADKLRESSAESSFSEGEKKVKLYIFRNRSFVFR
ncbi:unnamed protein product [Rotaria sp. Silwood2]|nr:unnamed protein product [Rotaria sp. Silwood2]CAF2646749.1 unnamed protein product [Rotaria sp. Silwood2]CAF2865831.1 unnamed protein product [Rotaria sp. Silwood2]